MIKLHDLQFKPMIPASKIEEAVKAVASKINRDYAGCTTPPIILVVLNGSFIFASDLTRELDFACEVSFIKLSSYSGTQSTGGVKSIIGLNSSLEGRDVIVIEDIVDTGVTLSHLDAQLKELSAASVRYCTLFFKPESYKQNIEIDYIAMSIGNEFIVGYGLDYNQLGRSLKDIYVVCNE
ncbi:MAG: hypoxanthine phosphoribosyltransferase [Rikenellaceae bacterium]